MQIEHWDEFRREMALTCEAFERKHTKELDDAFWGALAKMPLQTFRRACQFAREKAGQDGMDRLPKPGRLWILSEEARRIDRPRNEVVPNIRMPRAQHIAYLRRQAIEVAKRETMPIYKESISRDAPTHYQKKNNELWAQWDATYGKEPDEYWLPRAEVLMLKWCDNNPSRLDVSEALHSFA